jgi:hypothetical protein
MSESIGSLYSTEIPSLSENADIQEAFRLYHYGAPSGTGVGEYDPTNANTANLVNPSIAYSLNNLQSQITSISGSLGVQATVWTTKGDLVTRTSSPGVIRFGVGSDGTILTANSGTASGLEWATPVITLTNVVTLTNKTLTSPTITSPTVTGLFLNDSSIVFEGATADAFETTLTVVDPTQDNTITLPNVSGTVITTGNLSSITTVGTVTAGSFPAANLSGATLASGVTGSSLTSVGTLTSVSVTGNAIYHMIPDSKPGSYLLALTDDGKVIEMAGGGTVQIPTDASVNFPVGTQIIVIRSGASAVNVAAVTPGTTSVNATPGFNLRAQWSSALLYKRAANNWVVLGDLVV